MYPVGGEGWRTLGRFRGYENPFLCESILTQLRHECTLQVVARQEALRLPTSICTQFSNLGKNDPNDVLFRNENVKWSPDLEYIVAIEREHWS
jgi:hypothetical protein